MQPGEGADRIESDESGLSEGAAGERAAAVNVDNPRPMTLAEAFERFRVDGPVDVAKVIEEGQAEAAREMLTIAGLWPPPDAPELSNTEGSGDVLRGEVGKGASDELRIGQACHRPREAGR